MRLLKIWLSVLAFSTTIFGASTARADDWQSVCTFKDADLSLIVSYHADGPSFDVLVTVSGKSELGRGRKILMNVIQTKDDTVLFSTWDEQLQFVLRVSKDETASAVIEIGSGVSWDYQRFSGSCDAL